MDPFCDVVIIGAGASGLLCGSLLAEKKIPVMIFEKNTRVGKKLSATGNGRCNFTNLHMQEDCYYGDQSWIQQILMRVGAEDVIRLFKRRGIWYRQKDGYVYPHTNQASTVVDCLYHTCIREGARVETDCTVRSAEQTKNGDFLVQTEQGYIKCHNLILATGGRAGAESGGGDSGYKLARCLGHQVSNLYPGLTGLMCGGNIWSKVAGTRIQGKFSLLIDGESVSGEEGEIQITKNGVSGIPVFQLCRVAAKALVQRSVVEGVIDFVPSLKHEETKRWILNHGVEGLLPAKWLPFAKKAKDPVSFVRHFSFPIRDSFGIDRAQVTAGGVPVSEVNAATLESRLHKNLFLLGELLDIDGKCGGYNLHLAWSTAMIAASELAERRKERR